MSTFTVAVATGTRYQIGGSGDVFTINGSQPASFTFPWVEGAVLRFDQSGSSNDGNPLVFSTSNKSLGNISYFISLTDKSSINIRIRSTVFLSCLILPGQL